MGDITGPKYERRKDAVTHHDIEAIHARLDAQDKVLTDIRDALTFARVGASLIKWLGALGAAAVAIYTAVKTFKTGG